MRCISIYFVMMWMMMFHCLSLTRQQLTRINRCLVHTELDYKQKCVLHNMLYVKYESWAIKIGSNFKKKHYFKCKHIPYVEMSIYSCKGLLDAIQHYHPTTENAMFHLYALHHIRGQLYHGMTQLSPILNVSRKKLRNKRTKYLRSAYIGDNEPRPIRSSYYNHTSKEIWEQIDEITHPFTRRCIRYKFDYDFNQIRSNQEIARLMECSEETVRKAILTYFTNSFLGYILVRSYRDSNSDGWIQSPKC